MTTTAAHSQTFPDLAFISRHLFTAILWVNDDLIITWLNTQAEQLLAISRSRLLNQSIVRLLAPDEMTIKETSADYHPDLDRTDKKTHFPANSRNRSCSLTERFYQAKHYQQPFIDHDHIINPKLSGGILLSIDYSVTPVTYQQKSYFIIEMWGKDRQSRISEEQYQQQQYSVARHMLRSVAHEIKNPLAGIRGAAQLLQRQFVKFNDLTATALPLSFSTPQPSDNTTSLPEHALQTTANKLRTYSDIIISETDRLSHLIGQFLGSNQLPNWQRLNIHEPIEHVVTLVLSQYPQVMLQRDYDLSLPELCADKDQLIQVFLNIINNACEAMTEAVTDTTQERATDNPTGVRPQLQIQTRVAFQHTIGGQQHKQVMQITITDNGPGIAADLIGQIFFPMVTSRAAGTGLGLSIVQDIISCHHGMIDVSSIRLPDSHHNQHQTSFTLYLPFHQPKLTA